MNLKYNHWMLSPMLTDKNHMGGLVGLCPISIYFAHRDKYKILFSQLHFNYYSIINFCMDSMVGILTIVLWILILSSWGLAGHSCT